GGWSFSSLFLRNTVSCNTSLHQMATQSDSVFFCFFFYVLLCLRHCFLIYSLWAVLFALDFECIRCILNTYHQLLLFAHL
ncbi:hypothetical protein ILYODFUR_015050, partial [Ilyodon furcidens]